MVSALVDKSQAITTRSDFWREGCCLPLGKSTRRVPRHNKTTIDIHFSLSRALSWTLHSGSWPLSSHSELVIDNEWDSFDTIPPPSLLSLPSWTKSVYNKRSRLIHSLKRSRCCREVELHRIKLGMSLMHYELLRQAFMMMIHSYESTFSQNGDLSRITHLLIPNDSDPTIWL